MHGPDHEWFFRSGRARLRFLTTAALACGSVPCPARRWRCRGHAVLAALALASNEEFSCGRGGGVAGGAFRMAACRPMALVRLAEASDRTSSARGASCRGHCVSRRGRSLRLSALGGGTGRQRPWCSVSRRRIPACVGSPRSAAMDPRAVSSGGRDSLGGRSRPLRHRHGNPPLAGSPGGRSFSCRRNRLACDGAVIDVS